VEWFLLPPGQNGCPGAAGRDGSWLLDRFLGGGVIGGRVGVVVAVVA